jgi:PTH1 family peptidyl-tRNA hydrolase
VLGDFSRAEEEWVADLCGFVGEHAALLAKGDEASFQNKIHLAMQGRGWGKDEPGAPS